MDFVIEKDGTITGIHVSKQSGYTVLDLAAERAITGLKRARFLSCSKARASRSR
jgi:outer membrane biosynthesis protein TonB